MATLQRLNALALARALLAGPAEAKRMAERAQAGLAIDTPWLAAWVERCAQISQMSPERWQRLSVHALADLVECDEGFQTACSGPPPLRVRQHFLTQAGPMAPLPLGLDHCQIPDWPHSAALAEGLNISNGGLWRLTRCSAWQRRTRLGEQHYRYQLLAKRSGGWRLLEIPHPYLMPLQRKVLDDLLDRIPPHEAACGYRAERSVLDHARAHAGQALVFKFDLQDFFASVRASRVHALFKTLGYSDAVARELATLCTTATPEPVLRRMHEEGGLSWRQMQRLRDPHLPQGAPTSPALANLCAFNLDLRLQGLALTLGARYTRYADDLVLSGDAHLQSARDRIERWVGHIAIEEGFSLNHRKTRCLTTGRRQSICSIVVNQRPNLPRNEFDRLKAILHQCVLHGPATQNHEGLPHWQNHLRGRVAWAAQLNPGKAQRLQRLFERTDWGGAATTPAASSNQMTLIPIYQTQPLTSDAPSSNPPSA